MFNYHYYPIPSRSNHSHVSWIPSHNKCVLKERKPSRVIVVLVEISHAIVCVQLSLLPYSIKIDSWWCRCVLKETELSRLMVVSVEISHMISVCSIIIIVLFHQDRLSHVSWNLSHIRVVQSSLLSYSIKTQSRVH